MTKIKHTSLHCKGKIGVYNHTEEAKRKMSQTKKALHFVPWNKGKKDVQKSWCKGKSVGPAAALKAWETKHACQYHEK